MIQRKKHVFLWLSAGFLFSLLILWLTATGLAGQIYLSDRDGIPKAADSVMNSIRREDWTTLQAHLSGSPLLTPEIPEPGSPEHLLWNAYRESLDWSFPEEIGFQDSAVTLKIAVTCLDIRAVMNTVSEELPDPRNAPLRSQDPSLLLSTAVQSALDSDPPLLQRDLTLTFRLEKGHWKLVPNNALQMLLSGFTAR